jgi:hypothetical protein
MHNKRRFAKKGKVADNQEIERLQLPTDQNYWEMGENINIYEGTP